MTTLQNILTF